MRQNPIQNQRIGYGREGWIRLIMVLSTSSLLGKVYGFRAPFLQQSIIKQQQQKQLQYVRHTKTTTTKTATMMMMDPHDALDSVRSFIQHTHEYQVSAPPVVGSEVNQDINSMLTTWEALLSTLYATAINGNLQQAHEHTQPLFGPQDPILSAGKSIVPHVQNLVDMGLNSDNNYIDKTNLEVVEKLPEGLQTAISNGLKVIDGSNLQLGGKYGDNILPGFVKPGGILPEHVNLPEETPESWNAQAEWAVNFFNVVDKLPNVAFGYALVEFFLLRPGIDTFLEDIEEDETDMIASTIAVVTVRLISFAIVGLITLIIFGG